MRRQAMENSELAQLARENFDYRDGKFFWNQDRNNRVRAGDRAGTVVNGYIQIRINDKIYSAHRLVYALHNPNWDGQGEIDHINRKKDDNRIDNLRIVTHQENLFNTNTKGYHWDKRVKKWVARIIIKGKKIHLGYFDYATDARLAYVTAKEKYHIIKETSNGK